MSTTYTGDAAKPYKDQAEELKKDPAYKVGKEYQKLAAHPAEQRKDPRFVKQVEAFLKKNPEGFYAKAAQALIGAK
jgi:hypothetical protein